jgi:hypothetical protein
LKKPPVLNRDHRLGGESFEQFDLRIAETDESFKRRI